MADSGGGSDLKERGLEGVLQLPVYQKVYSRVPERKLWQTVKPWTQEEHCSFRPGRGTTDQLFTLASLLTGAWEFAEPIYMCFVNLEKAYD